MAAIIIIIFCTPARPLSVDENIEQFKVLSVSNETMLISTQCLPKQSQCWRYTPFCALSELSCRALSKYPLGFMSRALTLTDCVLRIIRAVV